MPCACPELPACSGDGEELYGLAGAAVTAAFALCLPTEGLCDSSFCPLEASGRLSVSVAAWSKVLLAGLGNWWSACGFPPAGQTEQALINAVVKDVIKPMLKLGHGCGQGCDQACNQALIKADEGSKQALTNAVMLRQASQRCEVAS